MSPKTTTLRNLVQALMVLLTFLGSLLKLSAAPAVVEEYFIPFDEDDILTASQHAYTEYAPLNCGLRGNTLSDPIDPIRSFLSFSVGEDNTVIVFDHWEDGYEPNPNVKTQSSTVIWGDGNLTNGVAPGYADDLLDRGDVVTIKNDVVSTTRLSVVDYDGGDRFVSTGALSVTRSAWATQSETLMAGATEVYSTAAWGTSFKLPVGENYVMLGNSLTDNRFEYTAATIQASQDSTVINIDADANGIAETSVTINRGQSHFVNGGLMQNATITSSKPVNVVVYTSDKCATYEADWYYLPPVSLYSSKYIGPVGTPTTGTTQIHVHNPNASSITVNWFTQGPASAGTLTIPANSAVSVTSPNLSGQRFASTGGENFIAFASISANATGGPSGSSNATSVWDWGYTLIPYSLISNQIISTSWSPGRDPNSSASPTANVSPIWLTADHLSNPTSTSTIKVCVDFNNNGGSLTDINGVTYDQSYNVTPLDSQIIYDPDGDQTAMKLWVCDGSDGVIAAAWGEDPNTAPTGAPSLDLGTTVLNGVPFSAGKNAALANDVNNNGLFDVGDTVRYTVVVRNAGSLPLAASTMHVSDVFPSALVYVAGSTLGQLGTNTPTSVPDDGSGTAFPLDGAGVYVPVAIPPFSEYTYTFDGIIPSFPPGSSIVNNATVNDDTTTRNPTATVTVESLATIGNFVWFDTDLDGFQDGTESGLSGVTVTLLDSSGNNVDSDPLTAGVQPTVTTTNGSGIYSFTVPGGSYIVQVTPPSGYSVSPQNQGVDATDSDISPTTFRTGVITIAAGATDNTNDAGFTQPSSISGSVLADTNNDNTGDTGISGVTVTLFTDPNGDGNPADGTQVGSPTTTATNGSYSFTNLPPGNYLVVETQPAGYLNVTDVDSTTPGDDVANSSTTDNRIPVGLVSNENDTGNDFIEEQPGVISGSVFADTNNDNAGDTGISSVTVTLFTDPNGDGDPADGAQVGSPATTAANGSYSFTNLAPGSYVVVETQPAGYLNVTDVDSTTPGDDAANSSTTDNRIPVAVNAGETDNGNDFIEEQPGVISGSVFADTNNDNTGDTGISGVTVTLFTDPNGDGNPADGAQVGSPATTAANGSYSFTNLAPGSYVVVETQPSGYLNVTDVDSTTPGDDAANSSTTDNRIPVAVNAGETDNGNDFIEELPGVISGSVLADTNNDNTGDTGISGVTVTLFTDPNGDGDPTDGAPVGSPATTAINGSYSFTNLAPGSYVVVETQPAGYLTLSDGDSTTPGDDVANASTTDNRIPVTVNAGETDTGNDFIENQPGTISGNVYVDLDNDNIADQGLQGVVLTLMTDPNGDGNPADGTQVGSTVTTDVNGFYTFTNLAPGSYVVVETQPSGYLTVSDGDSTSPGDDVANASTTDNRVAVAITAGETDTGNDFLEENPGVISGSVLADTNNDDDGDVGIQGVTITLFTDPNGDGNPADGVQVGSPITTNSSGDYTFTGLPPGNYVVVETQPSGYLTVSDGDSTNGGDDLANASITDNRIPVGLDGGENDTGNEFIEEQPGVISGSVLADTNNDNTGDTGISGVTVTLFTDPNGDGDPADGAQVGSPATTAANGSYSFTNLPPGNYLVVETQPSGYLNVTDVDSTTPGDDAANSSTTDNRIPAAVNAGETDNGNDFIEELPGVISGSVLADTNNDNTGDTGISGVTVTLFTDPNGDGNPADGAPVGSPATTAANGSYSFTNLAPGSYIVVETQPAGYLDVTDVDSTTPGDDAANSSAADNRIPVAVNAGETDDGNDFIEEQPGVISGSVLADTNNDNTGDTGLSSVTVTLFTDPNGDGDPADGAQVGSPAMTAANGSYSFTNLAPGSYVVVETQPAGYFTITDVDSTTPGDDVANSSTTDNRIPVGISASESDTGNDFIEEQPGIITGSVLADADNDNDGDTPIVGVVLTLVDSSGNPVDGDPNTSGVQPITTTTQPDGTYTFLDVPPGTYGVKETQPSGYLDVTDSDGGDPSEVRPINVVAGATTNGVDFVEELPGAISGSVLADADNDDDGDSGIAGATVTLFTDPNGDGNPADGTQVGSPATTPANGSYSFTNLAPGSYVVVETQPAGYLNVTDLDSTSPGDDVANSSTSDNRIPVAISAGESDTGNDFIEELPGVITGTVLADVDNDNDGDDPIPSVTLTLVDSSGSPVDGDPNTAGVQPITTTTQPDGTYTFTNIPPGTYGVKETQPPGYLNVSDSDGGNPSEVRPINVVAGTTTSGVDFIEEEPGTISGTVLADTDNDDSGDAPLANVTLTLVDPSGNPVDGDPNTSGVQPITTVTQPDGTYIFTNVPPGTYGVLETQPNGYNSLSDIDGGDPNEVRPILVTAGGDTTGIDFVEEQPAVIAGRVLNDTDGDGDGDAAISGTVITLYTDPNGDGDPTDGVILGSPVTTNANGAYTFSNLDPGSYVVIETQPTGFLTMSDGDSTTDTAGSPADAANSSLTDNRIAVNAKAGETDNGNDFIEAVPATIGDFIFHDLNRNGVQDAGEPGVEGVTVTLYDAAGTTVISSTTTNGLGRYEFADLNPGDYRVGVPLSLTNGDLLSPSDVGSDLADSDANPATGLTAVYNLLPAENDATADVGYYSPKGSIGSLVWKDLNRDGVQQIGEPGIENITVTLYDGSGVAIGSTVTDALGYYNFRDLDPGTYSIGVPATLVEGCILTSPDQGGNDNGDSDAIVATGRTPNFTLGIGENSDTVDIGFLNPLGRIGDFVWMDLNRDFQQNLGEPGIGDVTVVLYNAADVAVGTTTTNGTGFYEFVNLQPGTYSVGFPTTLPNGVVLTDSQQGAAATDSNPNPTTGRTANVTIGQAETNVTIDAGYISPFASIGQFVWRDLDRDGRQDAGEPGIGGVPVNLYNDLGVLVGTTTTDSLGYFHFTMLQPGTYHVSFPTSLGNQDVLTAADAGGDTLDSDADTTTGHTPVVALSAGQNYVDYAAGYVSPLGSIGDFVFMDLNEDGIQDPNEPGISGVTVNLVNGSGTVIGTTTTNATGRYVFMDLQPGTYAVQFPTSIQGGSMALTKLDIGSNDEQDSDASQSSGKTANLTLASGESITSLDAGYVPNFGSIGDRVFADLDRDGVQDSDEPGIQGVTVTLLDDNGDPVGTTTTDAGGYYHFTGLQPGDYVVQFPLSLPNGTVLSTPAQGGDPAKDSDPSTTTGRSAVVAVTASSNITDVDAGYLAPQASIGDFVWKDLNRNGVQDPGEPGIEGVTVTLRNSTGSAIGTTSTDATGHYSFTDLAPGDYSLSFPITFTGGLVLGTADQGADGADSDPDKTTGFTITTTLAMGENDVSWDAAYLSPLGSIGDFVWNDLDRDGVQDSGEPGIAGIAVTLLNSTGDPIGTTTTDSTGHFVFPDLLPGDYALQFPVTLPDGRVLSPTTGGTSSTNSDPDTGTGVTPTITLTSGQTNTDLDAGYYSPLGSVGDRVWLDLDQDGAQDPGEPGIQGVTVTLLNSSGTSLGTTTTAASGHYLFTDLQPGTYSVAFPTSLSDGRLLSSPDQAAGDDALDSDANVSTGKTVPFTLATAENKTTMDAGFYSPDSSIGDFVWRDLDRDGVQDPGEPGIQGVLVTLYDSLGAPVGTTITDATGHFAFTGLKPGDYTLGFPTTLGAGLALSTPDQASDSSDSDPSTTTGRTPVITLTAGQHIDTTDAGYNNPLASISNFVWNDTDRDGTQDSGEQGIQGVTVTLLNSSGTAIGSTTTDASGFYSFVDLQPGTYKVSFPASLNSGALVLTMADQGLDSADSDADKTTGITASLTLVAGQNDDSIDAGYVSPRGSIGDFVFADLDRDGVQDPGEPGIAGMTVTLLDSSGTPLGTTITDGTGRYVFSDLAPGSYAVQFPVTLPGGSVLGMPGQGTDPAKDSDPDSTTGKTTPITLTEGQIVTSVDAGYTNPLASIGDRVWMDVNRDGIQQPGEPGISGVPVTLYNSSGTAVGTDVTDGEGYYTFLGLQPGSYSIGFPATQGGLVLTGADLGTESTDSDANVATGRTGTIALAAGQTYTDADAGYVSPLASVGDFVWLDLDRDGTQDPGEPGIAGVTVTLLDSAGSPVGTTVTDATGHYLFGSLQPGTYSIEFPLNTQPGYVLATPDQGGDEAKDSDASPTTGRTPGFTLTGGVNQLDIDTAYTSPFASLGNFVWHDLNRDGVQQPGEPGIANVTVTLFNAAGTAIGTDVTDATGFYSFVDLQPGEYYIGVPTTMPDGLALGTQNVGDDALDSDVSPLTARSALTTLTAGENDISMDVAYVTPFGSIGDRVWRDIDRDGIQDAGEPGISNVRVTLYDSTGTAIGTDVTDGLGYYSFTDLQPGTYTIGFPTELADGALIGLQDQGTDDKDSDPSATTGRTATITLTAGQAVTTVDAAYINPPLSLGNSVWLDQDHDGVQDLGEPGIQGAKVELFLANMTPARDYEGTLVPSQTTGTDGLYMFPNLAPGDYIVRVTPPASSGLKPTTGGADPDNDNNKDSHGVEMIGESYVQTLPVTLANNSEPVTDGDVDTNTNLSVDIGFYYPKYDLALRKSLPSTQANPIKAGSKVTFAIEVFNQGDIAVNNVSLVDYTPTGLVLDPALSPNWTAQTNGWATGLIINPIAPGKSAVVTITYNVALSAEGQTLHNFAEVTGAKDPDGAVIADVDSTFDASPSNDGLVTNDELYNNNGDEDDHDGGDIVILPPGVWDLALRKSLANGQSLAVNPGDSVTYNIEVFNQGGEPAYNVKVVDYIPAQMTLADLRWSSGTGNTATTTLNQALQPGTSVVLPIILRLNSSVVGPLDVGNAAEIQSFVDVNGGTRPDTDSTPDNIASNDGPQTDDAIGNENSDQDDFDVAIVKVNPPQVFDLAMRKRLAEGQNRSVVRGGLVTFDIEVFNQGSIAASNVVVTDYLPSTLTLEDGNWFPTLPGQVATTIYGPVLPGQSAHVTLTARLSSNATYNATITNTAEISAAYDGAGLAKIDADSVMDNNPTNNGAATDDAISGENGDKDNTDLATFVVAPPGVFDLALRTTLAIGQTTTVNAGDFVSYTIEVFNQGSTTARAIQITDYIPAGMTLADANWIDNGNGTATGTFGSSFALAPGASAQLPLRLRVNTGTAASELRNLAEITTARDADGNVVTDIDSVMDSNAVNDGVMIDNEINNANFDEDDSDFALVTVTAPGRADLALRKSLKPGQVSSARAGDKVAYRIEVFNQGVLAASEIKVVDYIPSSLTFSASDNPFWTLEQPGLASVVLSGPIAAGASAQIDIVLAVADNAVTGSNVSNGAEIASFKAAGPNGVIITTDADSTPDSTPSNDGLATNDAINGENGDQDDADSEVITVLAPERIDLALRKTLKTGQNPVPAPGQTVCYTIEVFNQCGQTVTDIAVCDYVPAGLELVAPSTTEWTSISGNIVSCVIPGPLAPGSSQAIQICFKVADNAVPGTVISNCAEICAAKDEKGQPALDADSTFDANSGNDGRVSNDAINGEDFDEDDHDCENITVGESARFDLALQKRLASNQIGSVRPGDLVTYSIEVFNQGTIPATQVGIVDVLPAGFTLADSAWVSMPGGMALRSIAGPIAPASSSVVNITLRVGSTTGSAQNFAEIFSARNGITNVAVNALSGDADSPYDVSTTNEGTIVDDELNGALGDHDSADIAVIEVLAGPTLGDRVWEDRNANGIQDPNEQGIGGVTVYLLNGSGTPTGRSTTTDGNGFYTFTGLVPGDYCVQFDLPAGFAFTKAEQGSNDNIDSDADVITGRTAKTTIDSTETDGSWDAGLFRPAKLGGLVWNDSNDNGLVDQGEAGIEGISVQLCLLNGTVVATTTTDVDGTYEFANLPASLYRVKINTPPSSAPVSSSNTDLADNNQPGDDNGNQNGAGAPAKSPLITLSYGETDTTIGFGFVPTVGVGNLVFIDHNGNGIADDGEGVSGVTLRLYRDSDTVGTSAPVATTTTGAGGSYLFSGLRPGAYFIHIPATQFATGAPLAGRVSIPGAGTDNGVDDLNDENGIDVSSTAATGIRSNVFTLSPGAEPIDATSETGLRADVDNANDANTDLTIDFGFVGAKASTFAYWQAINGLNGQNQPGQNGDTDTYNNLVEYALCMNPGSGVQPSPAFCVRLNAGTNPVDGKVEAFYTRRAGGGQGDITYTLEILRELSQSPSGWATSTLTPVVTNNGDGTEKVFYPNLELEPVFANVGHGFVRLRVTLTGTPNTGVTEVFGWNRRAFPVQCESFAMPFLQKELFSGVVDSINGSIINVTTSAGSIALNTAVNASTPSFLEVTDGDNEGHRFELNEAATTATMLVIDAGNGRNTQAALPGNLVGDKIVVRPHWTLNNLFPKTYFVAGPDSVTGDRLMFFNPANNNYDIVFMATVAGQRRWVLEGDATQADAGNRILAPGEAGAFFVHPRNSPITMAFVGIVRANDFAVPLKVGSNYLGGGWPIDQSPNDRAMTLANGFTGGRSSTTADNFQLWKGDTVLHAEGYDTHFLYNFGGFTHWQSASSPALLSENDLKLFRAMRGVVFTSRAGKANYVMPMPWTP
ncbi:MAG: carboxypeptidase regulatory-like domain-containing protein [Verrucomicrobiaceae bacterium]|nr:carboxypeptidase regulatory-like domain-containing protein [Verrucomicrobiaceae bacterium]